VALRVLVVDDHPGFRRLASLLLAAGGYHVVGDAGDGASAVAQAAVLEPDVVILDVLLPDVDGFAVAEGLTKLPRRPSVVLVSSRSRTDFGSRLDTAPVLGFVPKDEFSLDTFAALIRSPESAGPDGSDSG
jgi:DNA-binding NarL/FixJ family response regulator